MLTLDCTVWSNQGRLSHFFATSRASFRWKKLLRSAGVETPLASWSVPPVPSFSQPRPSAVSP